MWIYENEILHEVPEKAIGFVYLITCIPTDKKYVGKKLFSFTKTKTKTVTLKNGNKKRKKFKELIDSDWKEYYGSSKELLADISILGEENFKREILQICYSKSMCSYIEAKYQMTYEVLENPEKWYNGQIMLRVNRNTLKF
jgi:hypothetical protein